MAAAALVHAAKEEEKKKKGMLRMAEEEEEGEKVEEMEKGAATTTTTPTTEATTTTTTAAAVEGEPGASDWLLVDLGTVVAHVFSSAEAREHYALVSLWGEGGGEVEMGGEDSEEVEEKDGTH